jgi:hypothetical protein
MSKKPESKSKHLRDLIHRGGYCALAMSWNKIADIEPDQWAIVNDKLYLNNGFIAQSLWSLDKSGNIVRGDQNWPLVAKRGNP